MELAIRMSEVPSRITLFATLVSASWHAFRISSGLRAGPSYGSSGSGSGVEGRSSKAGSPPFTEAARQFQDRLRQSAIANRIGLFESVGGLGVDLATGTRVDFPSFKRGFTQTTSGPGPSILGALFDPANLSGLCHVGAGSVSGLPFTVLASQML